MQLTITAPSTALGRGRLVAFSLALAALGAVPGCDKVAGSTADSGGSTDVGPTTDTGVVTPPVEAKDHPLVGSFKSGAHVTDTQAEGTHSLSFTPLAAADATPETTEACHGALVGRHDDVSPVDAFLTKTGQPDLASATADATEWTEVHFSVKDLAEATLHWVDVFTVLEFSNDYRCIRGPEQHAGHAGYAALVDNVILFGGQAYPFALDKETGGFSMDFEHPLRRAPDVVEPVAANLLDDEARMGWLVGEWALEHEAEIDSFVYSREEGMGYSVHLHFGNGADMPDGVTCFVGIHSTTPRATDYELHLQSPTFQLLAHGDNDAACEQHILDMHEGHGGNDYVLRWDRNPHLGEVAKGEPVSLILEKRTFTRPEAEGQR